MFLIDNNNLNFGFFAFTIIFLTTQDLTTSVSYIFTRSWVRKMMRYSQVFFSFFFYFIAFMTNCKVETSIRLTFCYKNMNIHDIRVINWLIPCSPRVHRETRCLNLTLSTCIQFNSMITVTIPWNHHDEKT